MILTPWNYTLGKFIVGYQLDNDDVWIILAFDCSDWAIGQQRNKNLQYNAKLIILVNINNISQVWVYTTKASFTVK